MCTLVIVVISLSAALMVLVIVQSLLHLLGQGMYFSCGRLFLSIRLLSQNYDSQYYDIPNTFM